MGGSGRLRAARGGPSRKVRLTLTGLLAVTLALVVGIVSASTGSGDGKRSTTVSIGTAAAEPAPAEVEGADPPAPAGSSRGVWWRPGDDQLDPSLLWVFDPSTNTGYQTEYRPTGLDGPYQHPFSYRRTDAGVRVNFLSVLNVNLHKEDLTSLDYDSAEGVLVVDRDGSRESWFGCSSGAMPAPAAVLC